MRKVVIISFYELKDYFLDIKTIFTDKYAWNVTYYPLYMYCYDKFSKIDNYIAHFTDFLTKETP